MLDAVGIVQGEDEAQGRDRGAHGGELMQAVAKGGILCCQILPQLLVSLLLRLRLLPLLVCLRACQNGAPDMAAQPEPRQNATLQIMCMAMGPFARTAHRRAASWRWTERMASSDQLPGHHRSRQAAEALDPQGYHPHAVPTSKEPAHTQPHLHERQRQQAAHQLVGLAIRPQLCRRCRCRRIGSPSIFGAKQLKSRVCEV